jgi:flagellar biosynthesis protein FliQ
MADPFANALREGLFLVILCAAPPLLAAMAAGLVMALLQAAFRIEERSLSTAPRIAAALLGLAVAGPWIGAELARFTSAVLAALPSLGRT